MKDLPNLGSDEPVSVRYVGTKVIKYDNICQTRTVWRGKGDVQLVPIAVAAQLARFPKVWEVVAASPEAPILGNPQFTSGSGDQEFGVSTLDSVAPDSDAPRTGRPILTLPKKKRT